MTIKREGRTQLVGYAHEHKLVEGITIARKMDLEALRALVEKHRNAATQKTATTAEEKDSEEG
jgi:hypothetical protein